MNPYENLEASHFWALAVAKLNPFDIKDLWVPKFSLSEDTKIVTYGSCFAQHISRALQKKSFNWINCEIPPHGLSEKNKKQFNYGIFSSRTGNIYTTSLLKQWVEWACDSKQPPDEIWEKNFRFYDPFRPHIEPDGFKTEEELKESRNETIKAFKKSLSMSDVFIFTLGLTECWINKNSGLEYPICPGVIAGEYSEKKHQFINQDYLLVRKNLIESIRMIRKLNKKIKFLLTVSPVPLTATMSKNHVLIATQESKSTLRSVAGSVTQQFNFIDYFPSYEIISSPPYRGMFYEHNQRNINRSGVDHVMKIFFNSINSNNLNEINKHKRDVNLIEDVLCEEELLNIKIK